MPNFDGTGPLGQGPMTGRGQGYCVLKKSSKNGKEVWEGHAGIDGKLIYLSNKLNKQNGKEVITMPGGDRTGPMGMGPMTGRAAGYCAGYPVPGYTNPIPYGGQYFYARPGNYYEVPFGYPPAYGYGPYLMGRPLRYGFRGRACFSSPCCLENLTQN